MILDMLDKEGEVQIQGEKSKKMSFLDDTTLLSIGREELNGKSKHKLNRRLRLHLTVGKTKIMVVGTKRTDVSGFIVEGEITKEVEEQRIQPVHHKLKYDRAWQVVLGKSRKHQY